MTTTAKIVADFAALFEGKDEEISLGEMKKMLTEVHKASSALSKKKEKLPRGAKKEAGNDDKPKRPPTAYNIFMGEQMEKLKDEGSTLSGKEKMQLIAKLWKDKKGASSDEEAPTPQVDEEVAKPKKGGKK